MADENVAPWKCIFYFIVVRRVKRVFKANPFCLIANGRKALESLSTVNNLTLFFLNKISNYKTCTQHQECWYTAGILFHISFSSGVHTQIIVCYHCEPNQNWTEAEQELPDWQITVITPEWAKDVPGRAQFMSPKMVRSENSLQPVSNGKITSTVLQLLYLLV